MNAEGLFSSVEVRNGTVTMGKNIIVDYKTKHTFIIRSSSDTPGHLFWRNQKSGPHENLDPDVCWSFGSNSIPVSKCPSEGGC